MASRLPHSTAQDLISASSLLLTAMSVPIPPDVMPSSLAIRTHVIEREAAPYDWTLQQARDAARLKLADGTATCDTGPTPTNIAGQSDQVPDCRVD